MLFVGFQKSGLEANKAIIRQLQLSTFFTL